MDVKEKYNGLAQQLEEQMKKNQSLEKEIKTIEKELEYRIKYIEELEVRESKAKASKEKLKKE
jgi:uncharacterized protein YdhG (YjbR/CyaY superfamily)